MRGLLLKREKFYKVNSRDLNLPNGKLMKMIDEEVSKYLTRVLENQY